MKREICALSVGIAPAYSETWAKLYSFLCSSLQWLNKEV